MRKVFFLLIIFVFCVALTGCNINSHPVNTSSRYNSQRMDKIKEQYADKVKTADVQENSKYTYNDNVLKIDMR